MGLNVLRQRDGYGAGLNRVGQHAHRLGQCSQKLLRPGNAVEEPADRAKAVINTHVSGNRMFELLQDRSLAARGVIVGREQEHGQAVDGCGGRAGDHIGRAGADGGGAGQRCQAQVGLSEADGRVDHRLLVAGLVVGQIAAALLEGLSQAADVAVAEDAEHGRDQAARLAVALAVLCLQELDDRLGHGQADGFLVGRGIHREAISFRRARGTDV